MAVRLSPAVLASAAVGAEWLSAPRTSLKGFPFLGAAEHDVASGTGTWPRACWDVRLVNYLQSYFQASLLPDAGSCHRICTHHMYTPHEHLQDWQNCLPRGNTSAAPACRLVSLSHVMSGRCNIPPPPHSPPPSRCFDLNCSQDPLRWDRPGKLITNLTARPTPKTSREKESLRHS